MRLRSEDHASSMHPPTYRALLSLLVVQAPHIRAHPVHCNALQHSEAPTHPLLQREGTSERTSQASKQTRHQQRITSKRASTRARRAHSRSAMRSDEECVARSFLEASVRAQRPPCRRTGAIYRHPCATSALLDPPSLPPSRAAREGVAAQAAKPRCDGGRCCNAVGAAGRRFARQREGACAGACAWVATHARRTQHTRSRRAWRKRCGSPITTRSKSSRVTASPRHVCTSEEEEKEEDAHAPMILESRQRRSTAIRQNRPSITSCPTRSRTCVPMPTLQRER
jgi:hypothetical protein